MCPLKLEWKIKMNWDYFIVGYLGGAFIGMVQGIRLAINELNYKVFDVWESFWAWCFIIFVQVTWWGGAIYLIYKHFAT